MGGLIKVGGTWKNVSNVSAKVGGTWKTATAGFVKVGGSWKQWFASVIQDSFGRADNPTSLGNTDTGQTWTTVRGVWGILSNKASSSTAASGYPLAAVSVGSTSATVSGATGTTGGNGLAFWVTDNGNWWAAVPFYDSSSTSNSVCTGGNTCTNSYCSSYNCTGSGCSSYNCTNQYCTSYNCTNTGCASYNCARNYCSSYNCARSYCSSYNCTNTYCSSYNCSTTTGGNYFVTNPFSYDCSYFGATAVAKSACGMSNTSNLSCCKNATVTNYGECCTEVLTGQCCSATAYDACCAATAYDACCETISYNQCCGATAFNQCCATTNYGECCSATAYNQCCSYSTVTTTTYSYAMRILKSVSNTVTTVVSATFAQAIGAIKVVLTGSNVAAKAYTSNTYATQLGTDLTTTSPSTPTGTAYGIILAPSSYNQGSTVDDFKVELN